MKPLPKRRKLVYLGAIGNNRQRVPCAAAQAILRALIKFLTRLAGNLLYVCNTEVMFLFILACWTQSEGAKDIGAWCNPLLALAASGALVPHLQYLHNVS